MKISIEYCVRWNYKPEATSLAATIKEAKGVDAQLVKGDDGVFEVRVDGEL